MEEKRIQAQYLVTSIPDDVPQIILENDALLIKNKSDEDITIPFSSIDSIKILLIESIIHL